jgi:nucleotide-binding universal stress UspA family protein
VSGTGDVVVGIDGSKGSDIALEWAAAEAELRNATLVVIHAWMPSFVPEAGWGYVEVDSLRDAARDLVDETVASVGNHTSVTIEGEFVRDMPAHALIERSKDAALLVVGSRGRGGFTGLLLGSVSHQVLHHAHCPVVVVPTPRDDG